MSFDKLPKQAFPSRFPGKCANPSCAINDGRIKIGDLIRWSRGAKPAKVWHDGACYDTRYLNGSNANGAQGANTSADQGANTGATDTQCPECGRYQSFGHYPSCSKRLDQDVKASTDNASMATSGDSETMGASVKTPPAPTPSKAPPSGGSDGFLQGMADALAPYLDAQLSAKLDVTQVKAIAESLIKTALGAAIIPTVTTVEVFDYKSDSTQDLGLQHKDFPELLTMANSRLGNGHRLNIWLTGPAGTGKTTAAEYCAKALSLNFFFTGSIDTEYKLMGFIDAQGRIVNTQFRHAYEFGGVFLFDEVDSSLPGALLAFNAALANGHAAFPDGIVKRHPDFCCIAAANTWGLGANSDYVGRLKLDASFLDRFVQMAWGIDEGLELATSGNAQWCKRVQALRRAAMAKGTKVIISPRATYNGAALLASGMSQERVETVTVRKAMDDNQWSAIVGSAAIAGGK